MKYSCLACAAFAAFSAALGCMADRASAEPTEGSAHHFLGTEASPVSLGLDRWPAGTFKQDLTALIGRISLSNGPETTGALMDAAGLYLSHMLLPEAASVLDSVVPEGAASGRRYRSLSDAVALLGGDPVDDFAASPLSEPSRKDSAFWASLQAISSSDIQLLRTNIEGSFVGLGLQSKAILRELLPIFVEVTIEMGLKEQADLGLRLIDEMPELAASSVGKFLNGRAREIQGDEGAANAFYLEAAQGRDTYAARARVALADLALRDGGRDALLDAQQVLVEGAESWRGDSYELKVLIASAQVYDRLENERDEVLVLGRILARFPDAPEYHALTRQAQRLLVSIYQDGANGKFTLSDWMQLHYLLAPEFRDLEGFPDQIEILADHLLQLGWTDLATKEYRRAIRLIQAKQEVRQIGTDLQLGRLNLKMAKAQLRGGLVSDARMTLELMDKTDPQVSTEEYRALKAQVLSGLDVSTELLEVFLENPSVDHLRDVGLVLSEEQRWAQSADIYLKMWRNYPNKFELKDASRLLIAAHRSGDLDTLRRVVRSFPSLTDSKELISIANNIDTLPSTLLPLSVDGAEERLGRVDLAIDSINKSGLLE